MDELEPLMFSIKDKVTVEGLGKCVVMLFDRENDKISVRAWGTKSVYWVDRSRVKHYQEDFGDEILKRLDALEIKLDRVLDNQKSPDLEGMR